MITYAKFKLNKNCAWFQASTAKEMRSAHFWTITQRVVEIPYQRFGATHRSMIAFVSRFFFMEHLFTSRRTPVFRRTQFGKRCDIVSIFSSAFSCNYRNCCRHQRYSLIRLIIFPSIFLSMILVILFFSPRYALSPPFSVHYRPACPPPPSCTYYGSVLHPHP